MQLVGARAHVVVCVWAFGVKLCVCLSVRIGHGCTDMGDRLIPKCVIVSCRSSGVSLCVWRVDFEKNHVCYALR